MFANRGDTKVFHNTVVEHVRAFKHKLKSLLLANAFAVQAVHLIRNFTRKDAEVSILYY